MGQCKCATQCCQKDELTSQKISTRSIQVSIKHHKPQKDQNSDKIDALINNDFDSAIMKNSMRSKVSNQEISQNLMTTQHPIPQQVIDTNQTKERKLLPDKQYYHNQIMLMPNGTKYEGQWLNGMRDGYGKQLWPDGSIYEGQWKQDKSNGQGKLIHADGDIYDGEWVDDAACGKGTYVHFNGARYEGEWLNDNQHGYGIEVWPDGAKYEGQYQFGKKNGQGQLTFVDSASYEGNFIDNEISGFGVYKWPDGREYVGNWLDTLQKLITFIFPLSTLTKCMEKALLNGQMENATKEIINKIKNKVEVCSILEMVENMQELGLMGNNLVLEYITIELYKYLQKFILNKIAFISTVLINQLYQSEKQYRIGMWQNGQRVKWLNDEEVEGKKDLITQLLEL